LKIFPDQEVLLSLEEAEDSLVGSHHVIDKDLRSLLKCINLYVKEKGGEALIITMVMAVVTCFDESAVGFHGLSGNEDGKLFFLLLLQFYYGDINMARDKFLQEQIKLDDGCIFSVLI